MANDLQKSIPLPKDAILLTTAQEWAANWNKHGASYLSENALKAFLIPQEDIKGIIDNDKTFHIRGYLGLEKLENGTFEPHMMVVGVDKDKVNDIIDYNPTAKKNYFIYDFSEPCPNTCNKIEPFINK